MLTLYSILDVTRTATAEEIKVAYYRAASAHHPDRGGDHDTMTDITRAYSVLIEPALRARYDKELTMLAELCPACKGAGVVKAQKGFTHRIAKRCTTCNGNGVLRWKGKAPSTSAVITLGGTTKARSKK